VERNTDGLYFIKSEWLPSIITILEVTSQNNSSIFNNLASGFIFLSVIIQKGRKREEQRKNGRYFHFIIKMENNRIGLKFCD
jgi:hypothetical protein